MTKRLRHHLLSISRFSACVVVLLIVSGLVSAIPLSDYHKNLQSAITALDTLAIRDEEETDVTYQKRLADTANAVRGAVLEKQSIEYRDFKYTVDNSWLHKRLDELEVGNRADQVFLRIQLIERLKSIEERVSEFERATAVSASSKAEANQKLANILARPEFETKTNQSAFIFRLLDRFIRWLAKFLPQRSPLATSKGSPFTLIAEIFVVALAAVVIIYTAAKLFNHFGRRSGRVKSSRKKEPRIVLGERLEPEESASDLLAEAEALARQGEIRAAIRKTYIALLVELGDRKIISLAQHKTNRDYLKAVSHVPTLYSNMGGLTNSFERHWYGFEPSSPSDWQDFKTGYLAALKATE